jgi:Protein of unknown function (DUF3800)
VRLVYLDESGTTAKATFLSVAGVIIHGDSEWPQVNSRIQAVIDKYIPEADRPGFVFHATDIFHGSRYFDRRKPEWDSEEKRWPILLDLANIIEDLTVPVVAGTYRKDVFGADVLTNESAAERTNIIQGTAVFDCLLWTDRWLEKYAGNELATVIHEDGAAAKPLIKLFTRVMRNPHLMAQWGISPEAANHFGIPLKRVIDTVHFAEKADARPLQLADLCAFILGRAMQEKPVPMGAFEIIYRHLRWILDIQGKSSEADAALAALAHPIPAEKAE